MNHGQRFRHWTYLNYNYLIQNLDAVSKEIRETLFSLFDEREEPEFQHKAVRGVVYEVCMPSISTFPFLQHPKMKEVFLKHTQGLSPSQDPNTPKEARMAHQIFPILAVAEATFAQLNSYMYSHNRKRFANEFFRAYRQDFLVKALQNMVANIDNELMNEFVDDERTLNLQFHLAAPAYRIVDDKIAEFHVVFMTENHFYMMTGFNTTVQFNSEAVQYGSMTVDTPLMVQ